MKRSKFQFDNCDMLYNNTHWLKMRDNHLWKEPYCINCKTTFDLQVDHIIEHNNNPKLFWDENNLQTLCLLCHSYKSNSELLLSKLKDGTWSLHISNNKTLYNTIKLYQEYCYSFFKAVNRYLSEQVTSPILNSIEGYGFSLYELKFIIIAISNKMKSKPKELIVDRSYNAYKSKMIMDWVLTKGVVKKCKKS